MKKILKRCLAYLIDMMVILIIAQSISGIPFLNKQLDDYNKYYTKYSDTLTEYYDFKADFQTKYKDKELTEKEYNKLIIEHENYKEVLDKYYEDKELSTKEYTKINEQIDKDYLKNYKKLYYKIERYSVVYFLVYLLAIIAYFIGFNYLTDGQTLGKKLLRLKIVSSKEEGEKVSIISYLIRAVLLYQPLYYIIKLIGIYALNSKDYYNITAIIYDIEYYLEFIILLTVMIRLDGRGLHDLLAKTRVASYDREGNEIDKQAVSFLTKRLDKKK